MALKFKLKSKDEAPAELQGLYVERDGAWVLDVEGAVEKARLDEARTASAALLKERATLVRGERRRGCGGEWGGCAWGRGAGEEPVPEGELESDRADEVDEDGSAFGGEDP